MEINKELVLSTAHIPEEVTNLLDNESQHRWVVYGYRWGWRIYVPSEYEAAPNEDGTFHILDTLSMLATKHDCKWLVLDQDGPVEDGLEVWEW